MTIQDEISLALDYHRQQNLFDAEAAYLRILEKAPHIPDIYNNLAIIYEQTARTDLAIETFQKALLLHPIYPEALNNLGLSLQKKGQFAEAIDRFKRAIDYKNDYVAAYANLGAVYQLVGHLDLAEAVYAQALTYAPQDPEVSNNLGLIHMAKGGLDTAIDYFKSAITQRPNFAEAFNNMGIALKGQGKMHMARQFFQQARLIASDYVLALENEGDCYLDEGETSQALDCYLSALSARQKQHQISPQWYDFCMHLINLQNLPIVYQNEQQLDQIRIEFIQNLRYLARLHPLLPPVSPAEKKYIYFWLFKISNFYMSYQHRNDILIQKKYARFVSRLLADDIDYIHRLDVPEALGSTKVRLGLAAEYLTNHNASNWAYSWLRQLPATDYEFFIYSLNGKEDTFTQLFASLGTYRWLPFKAQNYLDSIVTMKRDQLDILIIPEIGSSASSKILSNFRVAPMQCTGWGHPITSGSPVIDYYLTPDLMETPNGHKHYTETMVRIPHIGLYLQNLETQASRSREDFGLPHDKIIYGSLQSLYKYTPEYDQIFVDLVKRVENALIVFIEAAQPTVTQQFKDRLARVFAQHQLESDRYIKMLPRVNSQEFIQLFYQLDVNLDTPGWNGGNTTVQCLACDCPMVTLPGTTMRSRHSYAILQMAGLPELIADTIPDYVSLAVNLGTNQALRDAIRDRIRQNKHRLYYDRTCIQFLDDFFKRCAQKSD